MFCGAGRSIGNLCTFYSAYCEPNTALKSEVYYKKYWQSFEIKMDLVNFVLRLCVAVLEITRYFEVFQARG